MDYRGTLDADGDPYRPAAGVRHEGGRAGRPSPLREGQVPGLPELHPRFPV